VLAWEIPCPPGNSLRSAAADQRSYGCEPVHGGGGVYYGKIKNLSVNTVIGRAELPRRADFISDHGIPGCHRSRRRAVRKTVRNEENGGSVLL